MTTIQLIQTGPETTTETIDGKEVTTPIVTVIASETAEDARAGKVLHRYQLQAALMNRDNETERYGARFEPEPVE